MCFHRLGVQMFRSHQSTTYIADATSSELCLHSGRGYSRWKHRESTCANATLSTRGFGGTWQAGFGVGVSKSYRRPSWQHVSLHWTHHTFLFNWPPKSCPVRINLRSFSINGFDNSKIRCFFCRFTFINFYLLDPCDRKGSNFQVFAIESTS